MARAVRCASTEGCAAHRIASDIERIPMQEIDEAYARLLRQDVRYRFVVDMESLT